MENKPHTIIPVITGRNGICYVGDEGGVLLKVSTSGLCLLWGERRVSICSETSFLGLAQVTIVGVSKVKFSAHLSPSPW